MAQSKRAKGNKAENEIEQYYTAQKYRVMRARAQLKRVFTPRGMIYVSSQNDFFNLFDVIALKGKNKVWVQVKSLETHASSAKVEIAKFYEEHCIPEYEEVLIYVRHSSIGYRIHKYNPEGVWTSSYVNFKFEPMTIEKFKDKETRLNKQED